MGGTQCLMPFLVFSASGSLRKLSQCASMCDLCVGTSEGSKAHCTLEWFGMYGNLVYMQNAEMVYDRIWSKHTQTPSYYPQSRRGTRKMSVEKDQAHFSQLEPPSQRKMAGLRATVPGSKHTCFELRTVENLSKSFLGALKRSLLAFWPFRTLWNIVKHCESTTSWNEILVLLPGQATAFSPNFGGKIMKHDETDTM